MRYLLLLVLVVCVIGVMVPNVEADYMRLLEKGTLFPFENLPGSAYYEVDYRIEIFSAEGDSRLPENPDWQPSMYASLHHSWIVLQVENKHDGIITIEIPRELVDSKTKNGSDADFLVTYSEHDYNGQYGTWAMDYEEERLDKVRILTFQLEKLGTKDGSYEERQITVGGTHFQGKLIEGVELKQESEPKPDLIMNEESEPVIQLTGSQEDANFHLHKAKVFHSSMWVRDINLASYHIDQAYRIDPSDKEIIQVKNNIDETKHTLEQQIASSNRILNSVSTHDKRYLNAIIGKGMTLLKLGELDEAVETCKKALSIQQDMTAYHCMMSSLVAQAQRNQNWEEVLKQGEFFSELTLRDISHEASIGRLHLTGIVAWYHLEKYDEVLALLDAQESSTSNKNSKDFLKSLQIATLEKMGRQAEADLMLLPNPFGETEYQKFVDYDSKIQSYLVLSDWEKVRYYTEKIEKEYPKRYSTGDYSSMKVAAYYYLEQQSPTKQIEDVFSGVFEEAESKSVLTLIQPLYIIIAVVGIGGVIGVIAVAKRGSKTPKPVKQKPKPAKQKPVEKKETSAFCENCGNTLNPKAKFCGKCGNQV